MARKGILAKKTAILNQSEGLGYGRSSGAPKSKPKPAVVSIDATKVKATARVRTSRSVRRVNDPAQPVGSIESQVGQLFSDQQIEGGSRLGQSYCTSHNPLHGNESDSGLPQPGTEESLVHNGFGKTAVMQSKVRVIAASR